MFAAFQLAARAVRAAKFARRIRPAVSVLVTVLGALCCGAPDEPLFGTHVIAPHLWQEAPLSEVERRAHPGEMPPAHWACIEAPFAPIVPPAAPAFDYRAQAEACQKTHGSWHAGLWSCLCPRYTAFMPDLGCAPLPFIVPAQSQCPLAWLQTKTTCLRELQVGRSAWHLHFTGRAQRTHAVRQALADDDAGALVGHTLHLPPAQASWSMHLTDRLGPQKTPYLGFDDTTAILMPEQYTQAWVRLTSFEQAEIDSVRLAETCQKALLRQPLVPAHTAQTLCAEAAFGLAQVRRAQAHAWPAADSATWQSAPAAQLSADATLGALVWQLEAHAATRLGAGFSTSWRVVLREHTVLARHLQVRYDAAPMAFVVTAEGGAPDTAPAHLSFSAWTLTLVCDGTGSVQAWHIVAPGAQAQTGLLLPCHSVLKPRSAKAKRARLAPPALAP